MTICPAAWLYTPRQLKGIEPARFYPSEFEHGMDELSAHHLPIDNFIDTYSNPDYIFLTYRSVHVCLGEG